MLFTEPFKLAYYSCVRNFKPDKHLRQMLCAVLQEGSQVPERGTYAVTKSRAEQIKYTLKRG